MKTFIFVHVRNHRPQALKINYALTKPVKFLVRLSIFIGLSNHVKRFVKIKCKQSKKKKKIINNMKFLGSWGL